MEASAIAAMASSNALAQVQQEASVEVLRKALDIQGGRVRCSCCRRSRALPRRRWAAPLAECVEYLGLSGPARMHRNAQIGCRVFLHLNPGATN